MLRYSCIQNVVRQGHDLVKLDINIVGGRLYSYPTVYILLLLSHCTCQLAHMVQVWEKQTSKEVSKKKQVLSLGISSPIFDSHIVHSTIMSVLVPATELKLQLIVLNFKTGISILHITYYFTVQWSRHECTGYIIILGINNTTF